jgi:predicted Zn-dependent protease
MPEKIKRVKRRRIRSFAGLESFPSFFRVDVSPARLAFLIGGVAVGVALGVIAYSYGSKAYNSWSESRLLKRASAMLEQQDLNGATRAAQRALELHRDSLPAYRILAEATEKQNRIDTVAWRAQIARLLPHDLDSQLNLASAALRFGELDVTRKALDNVEPNDRLKPAYHVVAGWLARAQGDEAAQQEHFAAAAREEPKNDLYQFNLAVLQIKSANKEKSDIARATLDRLSKSTQFRTGALRALLTDAIERGDLPSADALAQDLQMAQQVNFGDYLLCLNLYRKLDEKKFSALLDKVKPVAARDPSDLALLIEWMNNNGLAPEVLKWVEKLPAELTTSPPPAIAIAESFAEVKNWSRLKRWARGGSWGGSDYLRLAYQAFAAYQSRQAGAEAEFDSLWHAAEHAAYDQLERELNLARLATRWNFPAEAEQLWIRVARKAPSRREALDALHRIYRNSNDVRKLYDVLQRLHENSPDDPTITANLARVGLNIDQNTRQAQELAKQAYDRAPGDVNCAVTYAFSLYGLGRTIEGLDVIKKIPVDQLHDPHAAVYVAVLLLDENQTDAAKEYIETARHGPIFAEEKKLLDEAMTKLATAPKSSASTGANATPHPIKLATPAPTMAPTEAKPSRPTSTLTPAPDMPLPPQG